MALDIYAEVKKESVRSVDNMEFTENGAVVYGGFRDSLLDLNNEVMALRNQSEQEVSEKYERVYADGAKDAVKWLFQVGDIREGKGERRTFNIGMDTLAKSHPEIVKELIPLIPEYTRWDYATKLMLSDNKEVAAEAKKFVVGQLREDMDNAKSGNSISLLAKWLPSIQTKKPEQRKIAFEIENEIGLDHKGYRKMIAGLREKLNVMEKYLSEHRMNEVNMENLTSHQNLKYGAAFQKWAPEAREEYLNKVMNGEAKMNAGVVYPYEIVHRYHDVPILRKYDMDLEALWKMLPDKVGGDNSTVVIRDGSGSMLRQINDKTSATCLDVATALSIYFAEHQSGEMKDKFITFSESPQVVDLSNCKTLHDKLVKCQEYTDVSNTNIEKTFDLLLNTLKRANAPQEDVPKNILIVSDMQFDAATMDYMYWRRSLNGEGVPSTWSAPLFEQIKAKWAEDGYELPRMIFWEVNALNAQLPMIENDRGLVILSGFSTNTLDMVLSGEFEKEVVNEKTGEVTRVTLSPREQMEKILSQPRYDAVGEAFDRGIKRERVYGKQTEIDTEKVFDGLGYEKEKKRDRDDFER